MIKLMKYEFQKQMFSKLIMGIILGVLVLFFLYANYSGRQDGAEATILLTVCVMVFAIFYAAIECLMVFEKDMSTKQSYMLFLVPHSAKSILGAKMLAAILQIVLTTVMFAGAIAICFSLYLMKYEGMRVFFDEVKSRMESLLQTEIDFLYWLEFFSVVFIIWTFIVMLGIFVTTLLNTVLNKNKLISFLAIVAYFVCFYFIGNAEDVVYIFDLPAVVEDVLSYVYYLVIDVLLFAGTAWLMDKKLSV